MQVKLRVLAGKSEGKDIPIPVKRFLIGRSQECHLRPKSDAISRNHTMIVVNETGVVARDLNSRNGTFVNGERIDQDHPLKNGDLLRVGKLEFEVVIEQTVADQVRVPEPELTSKTVSDASSNSVEFDVTEWLAEADAAAKGNRDSDPDTRQYKLNAADQQALSNAKQENPSEESSDTDKKKSLQRPEKRPPGKLPERPNSGPANSRDAAADMLKRMFNNR
jgi:predicted component of type VI protein secretion system